MFVSDAGIITLPHVCEFVVNFYFSAHSSCRMFGVQNKRTAQPGWMAHQISVKTTADASKRPMLTQDNILEQTEEKSVALNVFILKRKKNRSDCILDFFP